jgi:hypothetical protein
MLTRMFAFALGRAFATAVDQKTDRRIKVSRRWQRSRLAFFRMVRRRAPRRVNRPHADLKLVRPTTGRTVVELDREVVAALVGGFRTCASDDSRRRENTRSECHNVLYNTGRSVSLLGDANIRCIDIRSFGSDVVFKLN